MQKVIRYFGDGAGFAAVVYLIMITITPSVTTPFNTTSVLIVGGLIGVGSLIFRMDINRLLALGLHFLMTVFLIWGLDIINHWSFTWETLGTVLVIYIIIWCIIRINQQLEVSKINAKLRQRK